MPINNAKMKGVHWNNERLINLYDCGIGEGTKIANFVEIGRSVKIGRNCKIQAFVFIPEGVIIEDDVFIGPHACFTNTLRPKVGKTPEFDKTVVKEGAVIGANATILCGITIGRNAVIGAGAVVTKDVEENQVVYGPLMPLKE